MSVREIALIQEFPMNLRFHGGITKQTKQVGNAVEVQLATAVARAVARVHGIP